MLYIAGEKHTTKRYYQACWNQTNGYEVRFYIQSVCVCVLQVAQGKKTKLFNRMYAYQSSLFYIQSDKWAVFKIWPGLQKMLAVSGVKSVENANAYCVQESKYVISGSPC